MGGRHVKQEGRGACMCVCMSVCGVCARVCVKDEAEWRDRATS